MNNFIKEKIAIVFNNESDWLSFLERCDKEKLKWRDGRLASNNSIWGRRTERLILWYDKHLLCESVTSSLLNGLSKDKWKIMTYEKYISTYLLPKRKVKKTKCEFKVGEVVKIRMWDDMVAEYGYLYESINVPFHFTLEMKPLCGEIAIITRIDSRDDDVCVVRLKFIDAKRKYTNFTFSKEMIEPLSKSFKFMVKEPNKKDKINYKSIFDRLFIDEVSVATAGFRGDSHE